MLRQRLLSGALIISALIAIYLWAPEWALMLVVLGCTVLGLREAFRMLDAADVGCDRPTGYAAGVLLVAGSWLGDRVLDVPWALGVALSLGCVLILFGQLRRPVQAAEMGRLAGTLLGLLYVGLGMAMLLRLIYAWPPNSRTLALFLVTVVKCTDIGAYFSGRLFGRTKAFPNLSPKKTWEGCCGGVLFATGVGVGFHHLCGGKLGGVELAVPEVIALSVLLAITGIYGDLVESYLKRAANVKDSGQVVPGMGGVLDILDSLLLGAPVLCCYLLLRF